MMNNLIKGVVNVTELLFKKTWGKDINQYVNLSTNVLMTHEDKLKYPDIADDGSGFIFTTNEGGLVSVLSIDGTLDLMSDNLFYETLDNLKDKINGYMKKGHQISITFERDKELTNEVLKLLVEPQKKTSRRIGIDTEYLLDDKVANNLPFVSYEKGLMIIYTYPDKSDLKENVVHNGIYPYGIKPADVLFTLKNKHVSFIDRIIDDFEKCSGSHGFLLSLRSCQNALEEAAICVDRTQGLNKKFILFGDKTNIRVSETNARNDYSDLLPFKFGYQLFNKDCQIINRNTIEYNGYYHAIIKLELTPVNITPFNYLIDNLPNYIPFRVRYDFAPGGLDEVKSKEMALSFFAIFGDNQSIRDSLKYVRDDREANADCSLKMSFSTWAKTEQELRRNVSILEKSIQGWGTCQTSTIYGDPLSAWFSNIPLLSDININTKHIAPLNELLCLLPLNRPANLWNNSKNGGAIFRTLKGKLYPVEFGSRMQDHWIELIAAPPGSGKSVLLNTMNLSAIHMAGQDKLPFITIVDVGTSSSGLIHLIKDSLPKERKSEVLDLKLSNDDRFRVNPFDTQLGARYPTTHEKSFLVSLLVLFFSLDNVSTEIDKLALELISSLYDNNVKNPKKYERDISLEVDKILDILIEKGIIKDSSWLIDASWWEIVDLLFEKGYIIEANIAQKYAVPVMSELSETLNEKHIQDLYHSAKINNSEPLLKYVKRGINNITKKYTLFSGFTRYEINSETRIISIDLKNVIGDKSKEGYLQTCIFYLFARQLAAKNYFLEMDSLDFVDPMYHNYHKERIKSLLSNKKIIAYDEFHNTGGIPAFEKTVEKDGREGRKLAIRIICVSQYLDDYTKELIQSATSIFVMKGNNAKDNNILKNELAISDETIKVLNREANGPTSIGGNFLALFKTKKGNITQMLTNGEGSVSLWAFSTTAEDMRLRSVMNEKFGTYKARKILATEFPGGSAMQTIERLKGEFTEENRDVIETLANNLAEKYKDFEYE